MRVRRAFSLIELLVAIAVMALLVGILLPALATARRVATDAQCRSRLHQVFLAQAAYAADHGRWTALWRAGDESFSEAGGEPPKATLGDYLDQGRESLEGLDSVQQCPTAAEDELAEQFAAAFPSHRPSSYGINGAMRFHHWSFQPERVPTPSRIIGVGEQPVEPSENVLSADGVGVIEAGGRAYWTRISRHNPFRGYRHPGQRGSNAATMDGSVRQLAHEQLHHSGGHWFWWNATDPWYSSESEGICGCP